MRRWSKGCQFRCSARSAPIVTGDPSSGSALHRFKFINVSRLYVYGDHTAEAYSNCGRSKVLYAVDFRFLFWTRIFLLIKPSVWFAFFEVLFMCVLHERSSDIVTPRYLADGTLSSSSPCRSYLVGIGVLSRVTRMTWYFEGLKFMSQSFSQCSRLVRSCCNLSHLARLPVSCCIKSP